MPIYVKCKKSAWLGLAAGIDEPVEAQSIAVGKDLAIEFFPGRALGILNIGQCQVQGANG